MNIGKYQIERQNDGQWTVSWIDSHTGHRCLVLFHDLECVFHELVKPHHDKVIQLAELIKLAMGDMERFFAHPLGYSLVDRLPSPNQVPGQMKTAREQWHWHLSQWIEAYAALTQVRVRLDELEPYLESLRIKWEAM